MSASATPQMPPKVDLDTLALRAPPRGYAAEAAHAGRARGRAGARARGRAGALGRWAPVSWGPRSGRCNRASESMRPAAALGPPRTPRPRSGGPARSAGETMWTGRAEGKFSEDFASAKPESGLVYPRVYPGIRTGEEIEYWRWFGSLFGSSPRPPSLSLNRFQTVQS